MIALFLGCSDFATVQGDSSVASKGWRSLDLSQSPGPQATVAVARPLYRTQRSRSVPVQQIPTANVINTETPAVAHAKVRLACHMPRSHSI